MATETRSLHNADHAPATRRRAGLLALLAMLLTGALLLPAIARADELDDRVREVAKQLRCPVCTGESVADSNAEISVQMRGIIREKLQAGETPDQIKAYFVARYGESILQTPEPKGFALGVWIMPVVALVFGLLIVFTVLRSWQRRAAPAPGMSAPPVDGAARTADDLRFEEGLQQFRREHSRRMS